MRTRIQDLRPVVFMLFIALLGYSNCAQSQDIQSQTLASAGGATLHEIDGQDYLIRESVGQSSVIGRFTNEDIELRQGFLQPIFQVVMPEQTELDVVLFPNPFTTEINVHIEEVDAVDLVVYNLLFQEVFKKEQVHDKEFKLDLNELASGSYVLLVRSGNKSFTGQIQKIQ